jgi:hypothetical protein
MKKIGDIVGITPPKKTHKRGGVNHEYNQAIEDLMHFMGEDTKDSKRFSYWCGRLRKYKAQKIYWMMSKSKSGANPPALFNYHLKKENEKRKSKNGSK